MLHFIKVLRSLIILKGTISQPLGMCPPLKILVFDEGGSIDTITFNQQVDLQTKILEKSRLYESH